MKLELQQKLVNDFPKLYRNINGNPKETLICFGFDCGDGWYQIIYNLSKELEKLDVIATQVKEKWGSLRFYINYGDNFSEENINKAYDLIEEAEAKSSTTCEITGKPGKIRNINGWFRCLSDEMYALELSNKNQERK